MFLKTIHTHLSLEKIQHWHGYANISIAAGIYVHFTDEHNGRLADKMAGLLSGQDANVTKKFVRKIYRITKISIW